MGSIQVITWWSEGQGFITRFRSPPFKWTAPEYPSLPMNPSLSLPPISPIPSKVGPEFHDHLAEVGLLLWSTFCRKKKKIFGVQSVFHDAEASASLGLLEMQSWNCLHTYWVKSVFEEDFGENSWARIWQWPCRPSTSWLCLFFMPTCQAVTTQGRCATTLGFLCLTGLLCLGSFLNLLNTSTFL
jgi:hypothetical protein